MTRRRTSRAAGRAVLAVSALALGLGLIATPAVAEGEDPAPGASPPATTTAAQNGSATPVAAPERTCRMYASASGFGMLCSDAAAGKTLAQVLREAGVNLRRPFCWDDPDLPDGFVPEKVMTTPGRWWLRACLTFDGAVVRQNASLSYEFVFHEPGDEDPLESPQKEVVELITGRGQIPFLQAQASPVSSPRVDQPVAFSLLCDAKVTCTDGAAGRQVSTPRLAVAGVTMYAELVHLRVQPEGVAGPAVDCTGAGLPRTAEQLDAQTGEDPRVCRWTYDRSSNAAGGGATGDRYPARVTAYWQVLYDDGSGPRPLGLPYEKTTVNQIRVTEVQTLVVT